MANLHSYPAPRRSIYAARPNRPLVRRRARRARRGGKIDRGTGPGDDGAFPHNLYNTVDMAQNVSQTPPLLVRCFGGGVRNPEGEKTPVLGSDVCEVPFADAKGQQGPHLNAKLGGKQKQPEQQTQPVDQVTKKLKLCFDPSFINPNVEVSEELWAG